MRVLGQRCGRPGRGVHVNYYGPIDWASCPVLLPWIRAILPAMVAVEKEYNAISWAMLSVTCA